MSVSGIMAAGHEGDRSARARTALIVLALLLACAAIVALGTGPSSIAPERVVEILLAGPAAQGAVGEHVIVWQIRLPRVLLGILVGASLASAGALMQGLFRNPLADPGLAGVSSGSALAAVATIVLGTRIGWEALAGPFALPLAAFIGGLASTFLLYAIATREGRTGIATLLLAGIALGALAGALTGFLVFLSDDRQLRDITFWSLGGLGGASWSRLFGAGPIMLAAICAAPFLARGLNALLLGEAQAFHLGIRVERLKRLAIVTVAAGTAASVAAAGVVGFVGIVVPHLLRILVGADNRFLLPASALLGAILILLADMVARTVAAPAELPIGILTAGLGAPFFLFLLLRRQGFSP